MKKIILIIILLLTTILCVFAYRAKHESKEEGALTQDEAIKTQDEPIKTHIVYVKGKPVEVPYKPVVNVEVDEEQVYEDFLASLPKVRRFLTLVKDNDKPPRIYIKDNLTVEDLPEIRSMLSEPKTAYNWYTLLRTLCILEPDSTRALNYVETFLTTKVDWDSSGGSVNVFGGLNKLLSISAVGFIESTEAKDYLVKYLDRNNALQLARQINVPSRHYTSVEEAATLIQEGAANGLVYAFDDEYFEHVYAAFYERLKVRHGTDGVWESYRIVSAYSSAIGQYRFFQHVGLEEGYRLMEEAEGRPGGIDSLLIFYEPSLTESDQGIRAPIKE